MIPKIIHYCWFGGNPIPRNILRLMKSWEIKLDGYKFKCWNEENFEINKAPEYVKEAYAHKKYAFVSDYVRLFALYTEGGVYLDTDVEVLRDFSSLLTGNIVLGYEDDVKISTAFIASIPKSNIVKNLLDSYMNKKFIRMDGSLDMTTNVSYITSFLMERGFILNGDLIKKDGLIIYPTEYFSPKSWENGKYNLTINTYTIHHFMGTWHSVITKILSVFFTNYQVYKIASYKEKIFRIFK